MTTRNFEQDYMVEEGTYEFEAMMARRLTSGGYRSPQVGRNVGPYMAKPSVGGTIAKLMIATIWFALAAQIIHYFGWSGLTLFFIGFTVLVPLLVSLFDVRGLIGSAIR